MRHVVVGTAGHIDHGKSTLVRALTGIDPDRLKEEKERGITIDIGFAHLDLGEGLTLGIVDVPGHERFVKNMLAGVGGIDLVMLVVAADEGVMPQTREHLAICQLLRVASGLTVLTKADMAEPDWLELVTEDVRSFLRGTFLDGRPIVPVSAKTGQGLDTLRGRLGELRSEEHTSELQSLRHLVCRLLLEKKKKEQQKTNQAKTISAARHRSRSTRIVANTSRS